eukprot:Tamp_09087.p1 GENE.Tamp_09087~~Tamp_09087.p1  ORF type:complete len:486 (+),score=122.48 Tamp_09087:39-1460(+)
MKAAVEQLTRMVEDAKSGRGAFVSAEIKSGKDYDPTAAAREEKERREKRHKEAMEKKERKEMESCTFKPAVSRRSMELLQTVQKDRPSLHSPVRTPSRMSYKGPELQGKPEISEVSKALAAGKDRQGPIYERLISEGVELKRQKELLAEQHAKQESDSVIGVPQIDKQSAALVKSKRDAAAAASTVDRLTYAHAEKKKEVIQKLESEREAVLREQTATKVYTNARSQQLAKKMEAAGNTAKHRMYSGAPKSPVAGSPTSPSSATKAGNLTERACRPASAPANRNSSQSARSTAVRNVTSPTTPRPARSPSKLPTNARAKAAQSLDGLDDVETLRAEFERLVAERETTAAKAVKEMEAAIKLAREKESRLEQQNAKLNGDLAAATARCQELEAENERIRQERASLETQVATMTQRQKESDINEEHLNEKLKAITEKCQAVLVHNSKLQEQVNKSKAQEKASGSIASSKNAGAQI